MRDFKDSAWTEHLGQYDSIITNQAVHELRHKRHASNLHKQVRTILKPGGAYLVSDHYYGNGGLDNGNLYMTAEEQGKALVSSGFSEVKHVVTAGSLVLHYAA